MLNFFGKMKNACRFLSDLQKTLPCCDNISAFFGFNLELVENKLFMDVFLNSKTLCQKKKF